MYAVTDTTNMLTMHFCKSALIKKLKSVNNKKMLFKLPGFCRQNFLTKYLRIGNLLGAAKKMRLSDTQAAIETAVV